MKSITIIGNLGANAVRRMTSDGKELMSFNVAVSQSKGDAVWFNCIGTLREIVAVLGERAMCLHCRRPFRRGLQQQNRPHYQH